MSPSYWESTLKNIVGFMLSGCCFCAWFAASGFSRTTLGSALLATAVSLTVEVFQDYLAARDSGAAEIIGDRLGTWAGMAWSQRFQA